jgi:hypothetical protein
LETRKERTGLSLIGLNWLELLLAVVIKSFDLLWGRFWVVRLSVENPEALCRKSEREREREREMYELVVWKWRRAAFWGIVSKQESGEKWWFLNVVGASRGPKVQKSNPLRPLNLIAN